MKCSKCNGTGYIGGFAHVSNGTCFDCGGSGVLPDAKQHTVKYSVSYVTQFLEGGYFSGEDKTEVLKIENEFHPTAVKMLMEDDKYYYIGQPICRASSWFKFPKEIKDEFIKHYKKSHFGKYTNI